MYHEQKVDVSKFENATINLEACFMNLSWFIFLLVISLDHENIFQFCHKSFIIHLTIGFISQLSTQFYHDLHFKNHNLF